MCGTSATQIERTYYHLNDEMRVTHGLADYEIDEDGLIRPVGDWSGLETLRPFMDKGSLSCCGLLSREFKRSIKI